MNKYEAEFNRLEVIGLPLQAHEYMMDNLEHFPNEWLDKLMKTGMIKHVWTSKTVDAEFIRRKYFKPLSVNDFSNLIRLQTDGYILRLCISDKVIYGEKGHEYIEALLEIVSDRGLKDLLHKLSK